MSEKRTLLLTLSAGELQELQRILLDEDAQAALRFLQEHLRPALHRALDSG
jgi:hypothetical protein